MKVLFWLNVLLPLLSGVTVYFVNEDKFVTDKTKEVPTQIIVLNAITIELIGLVQVVTGIILVWGVYKIHAFFKTRNDEDCLDTANLVYHAGSFVLYLLATILYYVAYTIYTMID